MPYRRSDRGFVEPDSALLVADKSPEAFARAFKQQHGVTPTTVRSAGRLLGASLRERESARRDPDGYRAALDRKVGLLERLLAGYNDGRRRSLFCTAVNLLDADAIEGAIDELDTQGTRDEDGKARAKRADRALRALAATAGVELALRRART